VYGRKVIIPAVQIRSFMNQNVPKAGEVTTPPRWNPFEGYRPIEFNDRDLVLYQPVVLPFSFHPWLYTVEEDESPGWSSFWISPDDEVLAIEPGSYHGASVANAPELFGVSRKDRDQAMEEDAMEELEGEAISNGWISIDVGLTTMDYTRHKAVMTAEYSFDRLGARERIHEFITQYLPQPQLYLFAFNPIMHGRRPRGSVKSTEQYQKVVRSFQEHGGEPSELSEAKYQLLTLKEALMWLEKGNNSGVSITRQWRGGQDAQVGVEDLSAFNEASGQLLARANKVVEILAAHPEHRFYAFVTDFPRIRAGVVTVVTNLKVEFHGEDGKWAELDGYSQSVLDTQVVRPFKIVINRETSVDLHEDLFVKFDKCSEGGRQLGYIVLDASAVDAKLVGHELRHLLQYWSKQNPSPAMDPEAVEYERLPDERDARAVGILMTLAQVGARAAPAEFSNDYSFFSDRPGFWVDRIVTKGHAMGVERSKLSMFRHITLGDENA
jgi:hypothetical protein